MEADVSERTNYLPADQAKRLVELTNEYSTFNTIIQLLLLTGMRSGEVLGLTWDKIDFDTKSIFVDKTLTYITSSYFLSTPKTRSSLRRIMIDDETVALLRRHKEEQDKLKEIVGAAWLQPNAVFTSNTGHYYDRCLLNTQFRRGGYLPGWQLCPHAGLRPAAPCGRHPVGQQEVHEHEALRGGSGRRLYCWLTSFDRSLQINLRITLDSTGLSLSFYKHCRNFYETAENSV